MLPAEQTAPATHGGAERVAMATGDPVLAAALARGASPDPCDVPAEAPPLSRPVEGLPFRVGPHGYGVYDATGAMVFETRSGSQAGPAGYDDRQAQLRLRTAQAVAAVNAHGPLVCRVAELASLSRHLMAEIDWDRQPVGLRAHADAMLASALRTLEEARGAGAREGSR